MTTGHTGPNPDYTDRAAPSPGGATVSDGATGSDSAADDQSVGSIVGRLTSDLSTLMRQELELAKAEFRDEAKRAGKAGGLFGGAALAGWMTVLFVSVTLMWALAEGMDLVWAALIVTLLWAVTAAVLALMGRKQMRAFNPKPEQTIESLKEDKEWLKNRKT